MATRLIRRTWEVGGVLSNVTSARLSDPTGTYGVKRNDTNAVVVADGTAMTNVATGVYEYSFTDVQDVAYTAYVEIVYSGNTYHFEVDIPARSSTLSMAASYSSLLERVGHFLFGLRSGFSSDQLADIRECIQDGLHDVYTAHSWSFFKPIAEIATTAPYATGAITIAAGVVTLTGGTWPSWAAVGVLKVNDTYYDVESRDSNSQVTLEDTSLTVASATVYELGRPEYDLPSSFEAIANDSDLHYQPGQSDFYPPVRQKHDATIRRMQQDNPYYDRPCWYSVRTVAFDPTIGSRKRLAFYPTPDAAYVMKVPMVLRPTMIDETNLYPVGGEALSQVILEACLAAAERNYDEQGNQHTRRFQELLPLAIDADLEKSSPTRLGPDRPQGEGHYGGIYDYDREARGLRIGDLTLDGDTL